MKNTATLLGRMLLAAIFIWSGIGKIMGYVGTEHYIETLGVAGAFLPIIIFWELGGGMALLLGLFTRPVALALAAFSVITAFLEHFHPGDLMQMINFMKNIAMTGGFLFVAAEGAGDWSLDRKFHLAWA